jgi:hypothetical protein
MASGNSNNNKMINYCQNKFPLIIHNIIELNYYLVCYKNVRSYKSIPRLTFTSVTKKLYSAEFISQIRCTVCLQAVLKILFIITQSPSLWCYKNCVLKIEHPFNVLRVVVVEEVGVVRKQKKKREKGDALYEMNHDKYIESYRRCFDERASEQAKSP